MENELSVLSFPFVPLSVWSFTFDPSPVGGSRVPTSFVSLDVGGDVVGGVTDGPVG